MTKALFFRCRPSPDAEGRLPEEGGERMWVEVLAGTDQHGAGLLMNMPRNVPWVELGDLVYYYSGHEQGLPVGLDGIRLGLREWLKKMGELYRGRSFAETSEYRALLEGARPAGGEFFGQRVEERLFDALRAAVDARNALLFGCSVCGRIEYSWFVPQSIWRLLPSGYWKGILCKPCFQRLTGKDPDAYAILPGDPRIRKG